MQRRLLALCLLLLCPLARPALADEPLLPADRPIEQVIDHYIDAKLQGLGIIPAPPADDANLARRTMLDLVGRIPTASEARQFIELSDSDKRTDLVDRLLASEAYARHQADEFDTLLMYGSGGSLRDYLKTAFAENRSWDRMFREMIVGEEGDNEQQGAIGFVKARVGDLDNLTNDTSVKFFGINVSCAKCHDHPLVIEWTQNHFFGMKSFFSRSFDNGGLLGERQYGAINYKTTDGETRDAELMFLTGTTVGEPAAQEPSDDEKKKEKKLLEELKKKKQPPPPPKFSRRALLVEVALKEDQRDFFARSIVNHLWYRFYGYGLVMPIDQMHPENPPSHPELMDWLARDLVEHGYDLKRLTRGLVLSQAYARSSRWHGDDRPAPWNFAAATVKPLSPNQYAAALRLGSTSPDEFAGAMKADALEKKIEGVVNSSRGLSGLFEQPVSDFQVSVSEALLVSNSDRVMRDLLRESGDSLIAKLKGIADRRELVEAAVWNVFSRPPQQDELDVLADFLKQRSDRPDEAIRQLVWALLASSENRFNY